MFGTLHWTSIKWRSSIPGDMLLFLRPLVIRLASPIIWVFVLGLTASGISSAQMPSAQNTVAGARPGPSTAEEQMELRRLTAETQYAEQYYRHLSRMNEITAKKFVWQDRASEVTLWLVVFVVIAGISLAAFQLFLAFFKGGSITDTTLEVSASNFRITSSVVGLVVLSISIAFLYMFLREVYEIHLVPMTAPSVVADKAAAVRAPQSELSPSDFGLPPPSASPPIVSTRVREGDALTPTKSGSRHLRGK